MNKTIKFCILTLGLTLILTGCSSFFAPLKTSVAVSLPGSSARAVYGSKKEVVAAVQKYTVTLSNDLYGSVDKTGNKGESVVFEDIEPGVYKVEVIGLNSEGEVIVSGSSTVTATEGKKENVTVKVAPVEGIIKTNPVNPDNPEEPDTPDTPVTPSEPTEQNPVTVDGAYYVVNNSGLTAAQLNTDEDHIVSTFDEALNKLCPLPYYTGSTDGTIIITDAEVTVTQARKIGKKVTIMPYDRDVTVTVTDGAIFNELTAIFNVAPIGNVTASDEIPSLTIKGNGKSKITFTNENKWLAEKFINGYSSVVNLEKGFCVKDYNADYLVNVSNNGSLKIEDVDINSCTAYKTLIYASGNGFFELISGNISECASAEKNSGEGTLIHASSDNVTVGSAAASGKMLSVCNNTLYGKNGALYFAGDGKEINFLSNVKITDNHSDTVFSNNPQSAGIVTNKSKIDFTQCCNIDISNNTMGLDDEKVMKNFGLNTGTEITVSGEIISNATASGNKYKLVIDSNGSVSTED